MVDNIFIAIWFAVNKFKIDRNGISKVIPSNEKFGWIYYFWVSREIKYFDLRENYSSLSLRLHTQHGISATRKIPEWNKTTRNLNSYLVGVVKFPLNDNWILSDPIFNTILGFVIG